MRKSFVVLVGLLTILLVVSCAPQAQPSAPAAPAPAAAPRSQPAAAPAVKAPAKPGWEVEWEKVVEAAKREGKVAVYSSAGGTARLMIMDAFKAAYGIPVEWLGVAAVQLGEKLVTERRAGIYNFDFYIGGTTTPLTVFKPMGSFEPLEPALLFPDLTDPELIKKTWWKGKLSFVDKDRMTLVYMADAKNPMTVNTEIVRPGEVKSYKDILQPKFKGKIVIRDPSVRGGGGKWFAASLVAGTVDEAYMRQLAKQEPVISRDLRLQVEWVARGKHAVLLGGEPVSVNEFMGMGAPITQLLPVEGTYVSASHGSLTLLNKTPHPNAAKVFANWLLSREGQTVAGKGLMGQSRRLDVPTDHLLPSQLRQEGVNYFDAENEEFLQGEAKFHALAKDVFNIP